MLTRLRVQGFKNLRDFDIRFGPFTCVAGANAAGKSNLFDAIRFLHLLTKKSIPDAVQHLRPTPGRPTTAASLFTTSGTRRAPEIRFTAEMIVNRTVTDNFGGRVEAATSALEYQVAFTYDTVADVQGLRLVHESLTPVKIGDMPGRLGFEHSPEFARSCIRGRRTAPFITTSQEDGRPVISLHQEGHGGRRLPAVSPVRTVVGDTTTGEFPTILAVRREMESWMSLMLEPSAMRATSDRHGPGMIDERGGNLPAAVKRLETKEERSADARGRVCGRLANRLAELLEDVTDVRLDDDDRTETLTLEVRGSDGVFHPARSLSDGTLRFLVLSVLETDPDAGGLLCLEEPENGIHPNRIPDMVRLLKDIAVDASSEAGADNPLRQVIINTHSPVVVENVLKDELVYIDSATAVFEGRPNRVAVATVPEMSWRDMAAEGGDSGGKSVRLASDVLRKRMGVAIDDRWSPLR